MPVLTRARGHVGRIYHVEWPTLKHVENSVRGIRHAHRNGFDAIDLDMLITSDGQILGCHWDRPMRRDGFRDPWRRIDPDKAVRELTWRQVSRLVAGYFPRRYRINRIERLLAECARLGVIAVLEPKDDPRFRQAAIWEHLAAVAEDLGAIVSVYALPQNAAALPPARAAGFQAWEI
jgi:glycerophosphoryl diester phosphodiesterase